MCIRDRINIENVAYCLEIAARDAQGSSGVESPSTFVPFVLEKPTLGQFNGTGRFDPIPVCGSGGGTLDFEAFSKDINFVGGGVIAGPSMAGDSQEMAGNWTFQSNAITFEATGAIKIKAYITVHQFDGPALSPSYKFSLNPTQGLAFTTNSNPNPQSLFSISPSGGSVGNLKIGDSYPADPVTIAGISIFETEPNLTFPNGECQFNLRLDETGTIENVLPADVTVGLKLTIEVCALN